MTVVTTRKIRLCLVCATLLAVMFQSVGCSVLKSKKAPPKNNPDAAVTPKRQGGYLDFGDVLLPNELWVERKNSFVFSTSGMTAGVLSLKGRVDAASLITFFENKMPEDGWQLISVIKASRSMLLFKKQARWCVISVVEGRVSSRAEVWVAPAIGSPATGGSTVTGGSPAKALVKP